MNQSGYIYKNSLIHRMNPSLKFIVLLFFIVMIFLPLGIFFQLIIFVILMSIFFIAKLPFKKIWNIFLSIIFMNLILLLINWASYKTPGVIYDLNSEFNFVLKPWWLNDKSLIANGHITSFGDKIFLQGWMWGSQWAPSNLFDTLDFSSISGNYTIDFKNGFFQINGINEKNYEDLINLITSHITSNGYKMDGYHIDYSNSNLYIFVYKTNWYSFSSYAVFLMVYVSFKIFLMIIIVTILTSTTSSIELTYAFEGIFSPLKFLRLPINEWSMIISLSFRFIPSLLDEANRVLRAQASRGVDFSYGNVVDKVKSLTSLVIPMFFISFRKADELANAMEARGYNPRWERTKYRTFKIYFTDWIIHFLVLVFMGIFIAILTTGNRINIIWPIHILDLFIINR